MLVSKNKLREILDSIATDDIESEGDYTLYNALGALDELIAYAPDNMQSVLNKDYSGSNNLSMLEEWQHDINLGDYCTPLFTEYKKLF